jgi:quinohemoprotein ethanol dehydrogenase
MRKGSLGNRLVVLGAMAAWTAFAPRSKPVDDSTLRTAAPDEWVTYGRDYAETHFSPLKQINIENVGRLGLAWSWETGTEGGMESTPLISNGVLYGTGPWSVVFAVDARTGKQKWRYDPDVARVNGPRLCCGPVNRGVALYQGKVYVGALDGRLIALNAETGKVAWSVQTTDPKEDHSITGAPRVVKGKVIIGNGGAEFAARGFVTAYDADTGKQAWRFYVVPGDPSKPFENPELEKAAKTWTGEWWKYGGGGTPWDGMAYDPQADLLYIGTGNGGPWDINVRSPQGGDNLYLSSVIALKPETGRMAWYYQEVPGDQWDYTATQPMILADLTIGGKQRHVLMHAPKNGFFYVMDRITGELISAEPYARDVTWAKSIDLKTGRPNFNPDARYSKDPVAVSPSAGGAHNWHPMAFSPLTGLVYIPGQESTFNFAPDPNFQFQKGRRGMPWNTGLDMMRGRPPATTAGPGAQAPPPQTGFLVAWDPVTQKERWRIPYKGGFNGGVVATAGNLVFHASSSGDFYAYNAETGAKLWEAELAPGTATPVTYELDGKQYVSILAGRGSTSQYGYASDPKLKGSPPSRVFTFVLDGKAPADRAQTVPQQK